MATDIKISVASDTSAFEKGVKSGIINPLEDAESTLKDVGRAGEQAGEQLQDGFKDADKALDKLGDNRATEKLERNMKDAQQDTDRLSDDYKKMARDIDTATKRAGDDTKRNMKDGTDSAKKGLEEVSAEGADTAREVAASFDGSAESIAGGFQEAAANSFVTFGPVGVAAGIAAAAGIGVVMTTLENIRLEAEETSLRLGGMYQTAIEEGRNYITETQIVAEANDLIWNPDRANEYNKVQEDAIALGMNVNTLIRARSGDEEANNTVIATGKKLLEEIGRQLTDNDKTNDAAAGKRFAEVNKAIEGNRFIGVELDKNKERIKESNDFLRDSTLRQRDANAATREQGGAVDEVAEKIRNLPKDVSVKTNVDDRNLTTLEDRIRAGITMPIYTRDASNTGTRLGPRPV